MGSCCRTRRPGGPRCVGAAVLRGGRPAALGLSVTVRVRAYECLPRCRRVSMAPPHDISSGRTTASARVMGFRGSGPHCCGTLRCASPPPPPRRVPAPKGAEHPRSPTKQSKGCQPCMARGALRLRKHGRPPFLGGTGIADGWGVTNGRWGLPDSSWGRLTDGGWREP